MLKDFYKGKKVLLTGDTGFKGSWLAIWLVNLGAEVYGYALAPDTVEGNYSACKVDTMIHHVDGDIRDGQKLKEYFKKVKPDIAFHLAAQPLVIDSYSDPVYNFDVNVMGTVHFLEAVRTSVSTKAAVVITTDKCYQNNEWIWGYKEGDHLGGKDPYSASKACAELVTASYINSFFKNSHCSIATVRAGNVIGGGDWAANRIIPDFFRAYQNNSNLELRNPISVRPWQHVLEPLFGYLQLGSVLYKDSSFSGAWNFGPMDSNHVPVEVLIQTLQSISGKVNFSFIDQKEKLHEATLLKLDISKAQHYLNWYPKLNLKDMLTYTSDGYLAQINQQNILDNRLKQINDYSKLQNQDR